MDYELRVTVEKVAISTQEVIKRDTIKIYDLKAPESILDLGLRHAEQISLLEKVQNSLIAEQAVLIEADPKFCPKCGQKVKKDTQITALADGSQNGWSTLLSLRPHCRELQKLTDIKKQIKQSKIRTQLSELYDFIKRNQEYLVNYEERKAAGLIFTSQTAESHVETLINARHKRSRKCSGIVRVPIMCCKFGPNKRAMNGTLNGNLS